MSFLRNLWKFVQSFFPDYSDFLKRGYKCRVQNSDLFFFLEIKGYVIEVHQALEPFNPKYPQFDCAGIPSGAVVIESPEKTSWNEKENLANSLKSLFTNHDCFERWLFLYEKEMDFQSPWLGAKLDEIHEKIKTS